MRCIADALMRATLWPVTTHSIQQVAPLVVVLLTIARRRFEKLVGIVEEHARSWHHCCSILTVEED